MTNLRFLLAPALAVLLLAATVQGSSTERDGLDALAAAIVSEDAMEDLAAVLADPDVSPACKGYADLLLHAAGLLRHMLTYPESIVSRSEFGGRVASSLPAAQYACEIAT